jgi:hypothetical protein
VHRQDTSSGRRQFITVKADFLISPAYSVPTMITSIRLRWTRIAVSLRVPRCWVGLERGTLMIVKFGVNAARSSAAGHREVRAKMLARPFPCTRGAAAVVGGPRCGSPGQAAAVATY